MGLGTSNGSIGKPGGIGQKLHDWIVYVLQWYMQTPVGKFWLAVRENVFGFVKDVQPDMAKQLVTMLENMPVPSSRLFAKILSTVIGGTITPETAIGYTLVKELIDNPGNVVPILNKAFESTLLVERAKAQALGKLITETTLKPVVLMSQNDDDVEATMYEMVGTVTSIMIAVQAFGIVAEIVGVGQIQSVAMMLAKAVDSLDLQGITRRALAPVFSSGFDEFGRKFYNKRFRPRDWSLSETTQLYALRELSKGEVANLLQMEGYKDADIDKALRLAERRITPSDILSALALNVVDVAAASKLLYAVGYGMDAIEFILKLHDAETRRDDLNAVSSIALKAYNNHLISEAQFRTMRANGNVPQERINIEVQLAKLQAETDRKELSIGNIKAAYKNGVLAKQEASGYLLAQELDGASITILLSTWDEELRPKAVRLNKSTIVAAYSANVIDRQGAKDKLISIGWNIGDAELILQIADRNRKTDTKELSEYSILSALNSGIITYTQAKERLMAIGYSDADAIIRLQLATIAPPAMVKMMTKTEIINLYEKGFYTFSDAVANLIEIGYDNTTAEMVIIANASTIKTTTDPL